MSSGDHDDFWLMGGHLSSRYIDDVWLMRQIWDDCAKHVVATVKLLDTLGFEVHPEKSVFIPTQKLVFLGFTLDSVSIIVYLTPEKALKLKPAATDLFNCKNPTIRDVAKVLGLIAGLPASEVRVGQSPILMEYGQALFVWLSRDRAYVRVYRLYR